jgi:hypothetical protein
VILGPAETAAVARSARATAVVLLRASQGSPDVTPRRHARPNKRR